MTGFTKTQQLGSPPTAVLRGLVLDRERAHLVHRISIVEGVYRRHFNEAVGDADLSSALSAALGHLELALYALDQAIAANGRTSTDAEEDPATEQDDGPLSEEGVSQVHT